jgi:hypothetical protein
LTYSSPAMKRGKTISVAAVMLAMGCGGKEEAIVSHLGDDASDHSKGDASSKSNEASTACLSTGTCRCTIAADCPTDQACDATKGACTTKCSAAQPCNGGCCNGGTCAAGDTQLACGISGACVSCALATSGTACLSSGSCGCNVAADCPPAEACGTPTCDTATDTCTTFTGSTELTVINYHSWCTVTVATGSPSTAATQTICAPAGTVSLTAMPNSGFELGTDPWHDTDTTTQSGGVATETVTGVGAACVWACCEGVGTPPSRPCPTTDQCP